MTDGKELEGLLSELKCKLSADDISDDLKAAVKTFLQQERKARTDYRLGRLLSTCGIKPKQMRTFDQFDWNFNPKCPKHDILAFRQSNWIEEAANLVLIGDVGVGKSHIGKALCHDAVVKGCQTLFISVFDIVSKIKATQSPTTRIEYYSKNIQVLCLDELGYCFHSKEDTDLLFQIITKRSECLPTIVTTNLLPKQWGTIFSGTAASAILDRLSANGKFLTWEGKTGRQYKPFQKRS
jgi:DNA replication protein DnaC